MSESFADPWTHCNFTWSRCLQLMETLTRCSQKTDLNLCVPKPSPLIIHCKKYKLQCLAGNWGCLYFVGKRIVPKVTLCTCKGPVLCKILKRCIYTAYLCQSECIFQFESNRRGSVWAIKVPFSFQFRKITYVSYKNENSTGPELQKSHVYAGYWLRAALYNFNQQEQWLFAGRLVKSINLDSKKATKSFLVLEGTDETPLKPVRTTALESIMLMI